MGIHVELKPAFHPIRIVKLDEATSATSGKEYVTTGSSSPQLRTEVWQRQLLASEIKEVKLLYCYFEYSPGYAPSSRAFAQLYPSYLLSTWLCMLVLADGTSNEYSAQ